MRKFKGGGGSTQGPTESKVINTNLPDYVEPYFKRMLQRGEAESLQGYQPYGGQRLSYFNPDELTSQAMGRGFATAGTPQQFTDASTRFGNQGSITGDQFKQGDVSSGYSAMQGPRGYQGGTYGSDYQAGQLGQNYNPINYEQNISRFMSPYQQNVTDVQKREAIRQSEIMGDKSSDAAIASGGLGGYRDAIMQSERQRNLGTQLDDIQARGSQAGYQSAQQQLAAERASGLGAAQFGLQQYGAGEQARQAQEKFGQSAFAQSQQAMQQQGAQGIQAYQASEAAKQQAAKLGLSAEQIEQAGLQAQEKYRQSAFDLDSRYNQAAATGLMQAGTGISQDALSRMSILGDVGKQQRALSQAGMDMGYEDFVRQRDYTKNQLGYYGNLLQGVPVTPEQTQSTYSRQPGLFQTALGAGLSGLGLYKGMGRQ